MNIFAGIPHTFFMKKFKFLIIFLLAALPLGVVGCNDMNRGTTDKKEQKEEQIIIERDCEDDDCNDDCEEKCKEHDFKLVQPDNKRAKPRTPRKRRDLPAPHTLPEQKG